MDEVGLVIRGKVTDAKRITHFLEHMNRQHEEAVGHLRHTAKLVETLRSVSTDTGTKIGLMMNRERNSDLLTALSLLTLGTYNRLPTSLIESFLPKPPLRNGAILDTLRRLDQHIRYRLQCVDYLPPEMMVESIRDGRVYVRGGGAHGWKAQLTVVGFQEDSRWWLTGVEWGWRRKERGVDDPGGEGGKKLFEGEERQQILDLANAEVLLGRSIKRKEPELAINSTGRTTEGLQRTSSGAGPAPVGEAQALEQEEVERVDAPLIRVYNFLRKNSSATAPLKLTDDDRTSVPFLPTRVSLLTGCRIEPETSARAAASGNGSDQEDNASQVLDVSRLHLYH